MSALQAPRYLFLMADLVLDTVIDSQVLLPLSLLQRHGVAFDLVLFSAVRGTLEQGRQTRRARLARARRALAPGRVRTLWTPAPRRRIGLLWSAFLLCALLIPDVLRRRVVVCHCRGVHSAAIARLASRCLPGVRYLYDVRGDCVEEMSMSYRLCGIPPEDVADAARSLARREARVAEAASVVTCVSGPLKRTILDRGRGIRPDTVLVVPCAADVARFGFDASLRHSERSRLRLEGQIVLVYAGSLGPAWHGSADLLQQVSAAMKVHTRLAFLCVSPETAHAHELATAAAIPDERLRIVSAGHEAVPALMMAADLGLLVRPTSPVNAVACPTKLAEYLISGLVVLYSPGIGDVQALVTQLGCGVPVSSADGVEGLVGAVGESTALVADERSRSMRSRMAAEYLSLDRFLDVRIDAYRYVAGLDPVKPSTAFYEELVG
jgi:hypothetical protein